jgi:dihydrofolate reductase
MIRLIVAMSQNGVIGVDNAIPWHIKEEMAHFKRETTLHEKQVDNVVLMGRKTWESIPERFRPLPNRFNMVVSSKVVEGAHVYSSSIDELLDFASEQDINVMGGGQLYQYFLERNLVDEIVLSVVLKEIPEEGNITKLDGLDLDNYEVKSSVKHDEFVVIRYVKK